MKKLLWIGDAGVPSGFARATHAILDTLRHEYEVTVLAINFRGDPDTAKLYPYEMWLAGVEGDAGGVNRLIWMANHVKPDVIVIQQDGWNLQYYVKRLRQRKSNGEYVYPDFAAIPIIAAVAVDGMNFRAEWLDGIALAVFWTKFAQEEARDAGWNGPSVVIPLGVDTDFYHPMDKDEAFRRLDIEVLRGNFIVGNVNRNQPRKRWDLTLRYFAKWVHTRKVAEAKLFLHVAPTGDGGIDVLQMARYYGIIDRIALREPGAFYGVSEETMRDTYNIFDVQITTTQGEGFGLTTFEGMACGVPQIVPDWSALGELCKGAACMVPCPTTAINPVAPDLNVIGGVPDEKQFIEALDLLYRDPHQRELVGQLGLARARQPEFRWDAVGRGWLAAVQGVVAEDDSWTGLGAPEQEAAPTEA